MARAERTEKCHFLESEEESFALFNSTPLSSFSEYGLGEWLLVYIEKRNKKERSVKYWEYFSIYP